MQHVGLNGHYEYRSNISQNEVFLWLLLNRIAIALNEKMLQIYLYLF